MIQRLSAIAFFAGMTAFGAAASASPELHLEGSHFKDRAGRVVVLRGANVSGSSKVPPFMPMSRGELLDPLAQAGMNVIRLVFTWEAYEGTEGVYDEAYLDYIAEVSGWAWERGIHVIIDFHQDAFSRYLLGGCGDGFPRWALPPTVTPATPDNGPGCANWGFRLLGDEDVRTAWASFYADEHGARTAFLRMVKRVASRLDRLPGVVGYDIVNEPIADDAGQLSALYEDVAAAIREVSPTSILFLCSEAQVNLGRQTQLQKPTFEGAVYAPHFYDPSMFLGKWNGTEPDRAFADMKGKAAEWGVPLFLGEFGGAAGAGRVDEYIDMIYRRLDEGFLSATQWNYTPDWSESKKDGWNLEDFSIFDDQRRVRLNYRVRAFPRRIAGVPLQFRVTRESTSTRAVVELSWQHDPAAGETELFVPTAELFGDAEISLSMGGDSLSCALEPPLVLCSSPSAGTKLVRIQKKGEALTIADAEGPRCGLVGIEVVALFPLWLRRRRANRGRRRV